MKFKDSQSYKCFNSVCLWSLLCDFIVLACFFLGYILTCIVGILINPNFAQGFGWLVIVFPSIILILLSLFCFAVANGYLAFIWYLEYKKGEHNLSLVIVDKTKQIFNNIVKNNFVKKIIVIISIFSFVFKLLISIINFYTIIIGFVTFGILLSIKVKKINKQG